MMIRGQESAAHLYVKRMVMEILHELGAVVAEEAIFPNRRQVDVIAVMSGKIFFFEVNSVEGTHSQIRKKVLEQQIGKGIIIYYNRDKLPTRTEVRQKILEALKGG